MPKRMFDKTIVIVTPWFGRFAGGAESLARGMAREFNLRGVRSIVLTTCSRSPYDDWWSDYWQPGVYNIEGIEVRRFSANRNKSPYKAAIQKIQHGASLSEKDQAAFFDSGINSNALVEALAPFLNDQSEVLALPYFFGLTHAAINAYPHQISLIPCFHDEPQFCWSPTKRLLTNAKRLFYNSPEEKQMTIKHFGTAVGRRVVEGIICGVGVELADSQDDSGPVPELPTNYFVYAGRKERGKNVPLLCDWFAQYANMSPNRSKLVFIGGGDENLIPRNDAFLDLGFVPESVKRRIIGGGTAMLNLSENESFSIVLMEGWLLTVPVVVSTNSPVMKGHVQRCNGGLCVANQNEFCAALELLEANEVKRRELALNGQIYVSENFTFDRVLARYLDCLSNAQPLSAAR